MAAEGGGTVQVIMQNAMSNPDVLIIGIAVGFLLRMFMKRNQNQGFGSGGF